MALGMEPAVPAGTAVLRELPEESEAGIVPDRFERIGQDVAEQELGPAEQEVTGIN